ncbi:sugar MFS transporter [Shewanella acanthi]|uniref:sugar MFS transporter n=1 Tax=Shewanella acanthi TaxID=2864212 RepID=UPI001C65A842|nr:sugar MFS transporter [Shewanella acanthi]QYJ77435.1 sugar MFS transporter [Shewanella acanthi]
MSTNQPFIGIAKNEEFHSGKNSSMALSAMTLLFFLWGFITCLNDILIPHLKSIFELTYTQAMLIQFCFFGSYFLTSIPAGKFVEKYSYQKGIVIGLVIASVGCLSLIAAAEMHIYVLFLAALFVLASGITMLQVAANPYVTLIGPAQTSASRLNLTQAFNSLGTTLAPIIGGGLILSAISSGTEMSPESQAQSLQTPYLILSASLVLLAFIFSWLKLPKIQKSQSVESSHFFEALKVRNLKFGVLGIFLYVGAEVAIGSFLINFLGQEHIAGLKESEAANYIAIYWGGAMVGRFIGAALMQKISAGSLLAFNSLASVIMLSIAISSSGDVAMWAVLSVGLCNSIMFPTIFSLALANLGSLTSQGSGLLCLAIVGGAIVPVLQGVIADAFGVQISFLLPLICYLYIAFYGINGSKVIKIESSK